MSSEQFDLVVIGSGPGGMRAAIQAAKAGKRVAIVDKSRAGGGCVFYGTVPSKSLREAALKSRPDWRASIARMREVVEAESKVVARQLERNGVRFFRGTARFITPFEVQVGTEKLSAPSFVIATGTSPIRRPEFTLKGAPVYDSDSILQLKTRPKKMLVVGAGVIGCEYASIFSRLGVKITLADRRLELLRAVDHEAVEALGAEFREAGIELKLGAELGPLARKKNSRTEIEVSISGKKWSGDCVLVCLGREPNTADLGLPAVGVELDARGQIKVNGGTYVTSQPHIYAVGDVIGPPALAAAAAEQGRIAVSGLLGLSGGTFPAAFPSGIYTIPEISSFGVLENELREKHVPYVVGRANFRELARGLIAGAENGFIKLIVHRQSRQILGVHAIGLGASELIHIGQVVHALGAPVEFLVQNIFNYPTFAEAYKVAALNALNQIRNHPTSEVPQNSIQTW
ncbi:MAG: Si-specific NAD(P)(+) transhydrogenase [Bdellovibrionota bacterium]